jgi:hypothetical protein
MISFAHSLSVAVAVVAVVLQGLFLARGTLPGFHHWRIPMNERMDISS